MKLLFTQDALVNAGAERSHLEILSRFSEEVEVTLVYFYPKHDLKSAYEKAGIRLIFLDIPESYHFGLAISRLLKLIRSEKPDLLISSLWRADQITRIASWITGVPLVGTLVNDSYAPLAWKDKKGLKYKGVYWLDRLTARIPIHWIANAQALADSHVKTLGLDAKKISVVYRGRRVPEVWWGKEGLGNGDLENGGLGIREGIDKLDGSLEEEQNRTPPLERGAGGIGASAVERIKKYQFLSYGRLLERKGFQDAIQAFSIVIKKYPNCSLTIYGEGTYRLQLESVVTKLGLKGKVILPGKFNPVYDSWDHPIYGSTDLLLSANCFLFPSWYEGFSGALVEAMMAGVPIIASDIPMNLEAVSSENALIFEVRNIDQLSDQMIFAIENPQLMADLGRRARKEGFARFDIENIAALYEETLLSIYRSIKVEA